ncbi:DUF3883 domain-containing protein [Asanoa sp. NPDC050611]|uniref:protein NO VEIN domain-containing protein n=1 Tax=Asanoa sp. NPDC050611 TaxID=3157098 RepID=UPI00340F474B
MALVSGNRAVENAAVKFVLAWEAAQGRPSRDTRGTGAAADVAGDVRSIEVKAFGQWARGEDLWLEPRQKAEAEANPNFWIYVVENVRQGNPALFHLITIGGDELRRLLQRAVERSYYTVPWPVADYDALSLTHGRARNT